MDLDTHIHPKQSHALIIEAYTIALTRTDFKVLIDVLIFQQQTQWLYFASELFRFWELWIQFTVE